MELIVIGLNHHTAPIAIRECLAFSEGKLEDALSKVHALPSLKENMILSTCNRVEVYAAARETEKATFDLKNFLSQYHGLPLKEFEKSLYSHIGEEAVRHIFRVASSLDSMVLGEPQILGQIKDAYDVAQQAKTSGLILHRLLHRAFHVAKRVRAETKIALSAVSVSSVAVECAEKIFGTLEKKTVLLIGAGEMCELAARHLVSAGIEKILVTNRTFERALTLAQEFRGEAIPLEGMAQGLKKTDIVISATNSPQYLIEHNQITKVMKDRKQKPIFFIDISDPRDIEPKVGDLENVYLYNIDDLQKVANENIKDREKEAQRAEMIVQDEVVKFVNWYRSLDVTPTIVSLRNKFEEIRKKELEKTLSIHPNLSQKEKQSLEALTSAIINKILHTPITLLKRTEEEAMADLYLDALHALFQLSGKSLETVSEKFEEEKEKEEPKLEDAL
ncbi:MAG: glutamyl-tRNA reductase [Deltaproteobacteria bacterium RBG_19FT_COMBO_46_12]|nr:MAG: glutamyl-tRNA reductase [Deltaproteobacteria bacterium RBG_19FT_COMBO_46_12]